jgi:hypothetical protein
MKRLENLVQRVVEDSVLSQNFEQELPGENITCTACHKLHLVDLAVSELNGSSTNEQMPESLGEGLVYRWQAM